MTAPAPPGDPRALLTELYWAAVTAAAPGPALSAALASETLESRRRLHLLALGKAALPMAQAAVDFLASRGQEPAGGLLVTPEPADAPHPRLGVAMGDHPEPGARSLRAADELGRAVGRVRPEDSVWVLLSGGTTSLIGAPIDGIDPADLTALYRLLLGSGLDITAMNRIRKRFTRWSGGRLAVALAPAHVKNFTISDVIGDDPGAIGSGPCVPDPSTAAQVHAALTEAGLWQRIPAALRDHLTAVQSGRAPETPKPDHPAFRTTLVTIVASNRLALEAACRAAADRGLDARLIDSALAGEAADAGRRIAATILSYDGTGRPGAQVGGVNKNALLVWGGETTVTLTPDAGTGGRSQELALAAARELAGAARRDGWTATLLAAGTDGRDGPTDAAGAFADASTWERIRRAGRDPAEDLARHRSHAALEAGGALFRTGMTGTNVMDLVFGLVSSAR
jgi:glycerate 2-kinase